MRKLSVGYGALIWGVFTVRGRPKSEIRGDSLDLPIAIAGWVRSLAPADLACGRCLFMLPAPLLRLLQGAPSGGGQIFNRAGFSGFVFRFVQGSFPVTHVAIC